MSADCDLRCCEVVRRELGRGASLVYGVHTREARVVAPIVADALLAARRRRPRAAHIAAATRERDPAEAAVIADGLTTLAAAGLFVARHELRPVTRAPDAPPPLDLAAIPSADRPETAARAARSLLEHARAHGRPLELLVADGSRDPATRAAYRGLLAALAREHPAQIVHVGAEERRALIARLAARGLDPGLAAFALASEEYPHMSYGTGRNAISLHALGRRVLCVDDDVIARPVAPIDPLPGLALFTGEGEGYANYQPQDIRFYPDHAAALADARGSAEDLLAAHARLLGRSLPAVIAAVPADEPVDFDDCLDPAIARRLRAGEGRVRVSFQGLLGDLGWYAPTWCLLFEGDNRERLLASEAEYLRVLGSSRAALRVARRWTVGDGRYCQGAVLGLDHTAALPPFLPVGRYEDGVFRTTLRALDEAALFGHVPSAMLHEPPAPRSWARDDIWRTGGWTRLGELVVQCVRACPSPTTPAALGAHLRALGALAPAEFRAFAAQRLWRQKALYAAHLEALLDRHDHAPRWWADDVRRHLDALAAHAARPEYPAPRDLLASAADPAAALVAAQRLLDRFGALLAIWPQLCDEVAAQGQPLGLKIRP